MEIKGRILPGKILVKKDENKTKSGLYIPETSDKTINIGTVVLVGSIPEKMNIELEVGDRVMFYPHAASTPNQVELDAQILYLMNLTDIQVIF